MFTVKKTLCPIDFSDATGLAIDAAVAVARSFTAELYLLHVVEGPAIDGDAVDTGRHEASREAVRARLAGLVEGRELGVEVHVLVSDGSPAEEILRMEEFFGIELIVLAPHGRSTLGKIIFGSVTDKVTRGSKAHILLVKREPDDPDADVAD